MFFFIPNNRLLLVNEDIERNVAEINKEYYNLGFDLCIRKYAPHDYFHILVTFNCEKAKRLWNYFTTLFLDTSYNQVSTIPIKGFLKNFTMSDNLGEIYSMKEFFLIFIIIIFLILLTW
jgi:hypothetical protein